MKTERIRWYVLLLVCTFIIGRKSTQAQQQTVVQEAHGAGIFNIDLQGNYYFPKDVEFAGNIPKNHVASPSSLPHLFQTTVADSRVCNCSTASF